MVRKILVSLVLCLVILGGNIVMPTPASATPYAPGPIRAGFGFVVNAPIANVDIVTSCKGFNWQCGQGTYILSTAGGVYAVNAPYFGGANGQGYFAGRTARNLYFCSNGGMITGYIIVTTSGESYHYGPYSSCLL